MELAHKIRGVPKGLPPGRYKVSTDAVLPRVGPKGVGVQVVGTLELSTLEAARAAGIEVDEDGYAPCWSCGDKHDVEDAFCYGCRQVVCCDCDETDGVLGTSHCVEDHFPDTYGEEL